MASVSFGSAGQEDVPALPCRHPGLLMAAVMGASVIQFLDATIANVAIPHMQSSLGASLDSVTWVLTSFIIAGAVATPIVGWVSDRFGSRRLFLFVVAAFIVTSMLCGAAANLTQMVIFRILQGFCAAFIGPLGQTIMLDITAPSKQARAMSLWGMAVMIAPISGPMIGGWLTESLNWRWVFYVNLPIGIPTLFVLWWLLPSRPIVDRKLDLFGFSAFALGLAALQLMFDRGQHKDWFDSWEIIIECGLAISFLWVFFVHIRTTDNPLFPKELVGDRNFLMVLVFMILMGIMMIAISALLPPLLQNIYGYTVFDTGVLLAPRGVGIFITMIVANRLLGKIDLRYMVAFGYTVAAWSLWEMTGWTSSMGKSDIIIVGLVQGLGMGLTFMPMNVIAFSNIPPAFRTDGSGLMNLMRNVGASMGISLVTTMLARNIQVSHADLAQHVTPYNMPGVDPGATAERLGSVGEGLMRVIDGMVNREAAMIAYLDDFQMMAIVVLCFVPMAFLLKMPNMAPGSAPPPVSE
jgi:DHA2 family multidrug resistance protein